MRWGIISIARHYRVYATPPFFVPFPSLIGTLGAFIRIKSPIPSRAALFDIGIAGPIAGFIPACVALVVGLSLSHPVAGPTPPQFQLGFPLAFHDRAPASWSLARRSPRLSLHPLAAAAWVGMFATALNLLPGGQLDGGHILYSISPGLHRVVTLLTVLRARAARKISLDRMVPVGGAAGPYRQAPTFPRIPKSLDAAVPSHFADC